MISRINYIHELYDLENCQKHVTTEAEAELNKMTNDLLFLTENC